MELIEINDNQNDNEIDPNHIIDIRTVQSSAIKILVEALKEILTDTNIILWTFNEGPDFREAILNVVPGADIAVPTCVISELKTLNTTESKAALEMCKKIKIEDIGNGYVDDLLVEAAKNGHLIATNDKELLNRLKALKLNALKIREKNKLVSTEGI